jgi:hypothetical protein
VFRDIEKEERDAVAEKRRIIREEKKKQDQDQDRAIVGYDGSNDAPKSPVREMRPAPGHAVPGETRGALHIARGALSDRKSRPLPKVLTPPSLFSWRRQQRAKAKA